jgi:hypothetical protein
MADDNSFDEDQRIVQEIIGRFDAPAFMRRAKQVETSWSNLMEQLAKVRSEKLEIVRLRIGQLYALADRWETLRTWIVVEEDLVALQRLHDELQPRLRMPLLSTTSQRKLRSALCALLQAMTAFNQRWSKLLAKTDLKTVNAARDAYNRYYLLEKECALGSARVARIDFKRVEPATLDDLRKQFPLLRLPHIAG